MSQDSFDFGDSGIKTPANVAPDFLPSIVKGDHCPTCGQYAKIYSGRTITGVMAYVLILMYRDYREGTDPLPEFKKVKTIFQERSVPVAIQSSTDWVKLRYWGLLDQLKSYRNDGSNRVGIYRITGKGCLFVQGLLTVPKNTAFYNQECLGVVGGPWTIQDALGEQFNYRELMG